MGPDDDLTPFEKAIEVAEATPSEQQQGLEKTYRAIGVGLMTEFKDGFREAVNREDRTTERALQLATKQQQLARVVNLFAMRPGLVPGNDSPEKTLRVALFYSESGDRGSVSYDKDPKKAELIEAHMVGALGMVTFYDLLKQSGVAGVSEIEFRQILTDPRSDVEDKVDLQLSWMKGDTRVIRLVQLKTETTATRTFISEVFQHEGEKGIHFPLDISYSGAKRLLNVRNKVEASITANGESADVKAFVVTVPAYNSSVNEGGGRRSFVLNGALATVRDDVRGREIIEQFSEDAKKSKLLV